MEYVAKGQGGFCRWYVFVALYLRSGCGRGETVCVVKTGQVKCSLLLLRCEIPRSEKGDRGPGLPSACSIFMCQLVVCLGISGNDRR